MNDSGLSGQVSNDAVAVWARGSEQLVVGWMFWSDEAIDRFSHTLSPAHFVDDFCRDAFAALSAAYHSNHQEFDPVAVVERDLLPKHKTAIGDVARLANGCHHRRTSGEVFRWHENILQRALMARGVQWVGDQLLAIGRADDPVEYYRKVISKFEAKRAEVDFDPPSFTDQAAEYLERCRDAKPIHLTTGNQWLDASECLTPGCNVVIAGLPGTGKSAFAVQTCVTAARRGLTSAFFSFEMSTSEIVERALMVAAGVTKAQVHDVAIVSEHMSTLEGRFFVFGQQGRMKVSDVAARVAMVKPRIVVVDHMGLLTAPGDKRYEVMSTISRDLKLMAADLDVSLISLCQLNRSVGDDEPKMRHLRDSGKIEEDATAVIFLHETKEGDVDILVRKNRSGKIGAYRGIKFDKDRQTFSEGDDDDY